MALEQLHRVVVVQKADGFLLVKQIQPVIDHLENLVEIDALPVGAGMTRSTRGSFGDFQP